MTVAERPIVAAADIRWELAPALTVATDDLLVEALVAADSYRTLAQQALHALHELQGDLARLKHRNAQLRDENRTLRTQAHRGTA